MSPTLRFQLRELDRALLSLVEERVRLFALVAGDTPPCAAVDDILRRHAGALGASSVRDLFETLDAVTTEAAK